MTPQQIRVAFKGLSAKIQQRLLLQLTIEHEYAAGVEGLTAHDIAHGMAPAMETAVEALRDIAAGRPELDDWGDHDPQRIARNALRRIRAATKQQRKRR